MLWLLVFFIGKDSVKAEIGYGIERSKKDKRYKKKSSETD